MCQVGHRNVTECVRCCKNTNSEDKVTCLACKHASSAHISTTNIFFLSDRDSGTGQKQAVPWRGSSGSPAFQYFRMTHIWVQYLFLILSGNTKVWHFGFISSSSLNIELLQWWKTIALIMTVIVFCAYSICHLLWQWDPAWFPWVEHVTADQTDLKPAKEKSQNHYNMKHYDSFSGHQK